MPDAKRESNRAANSQASAAAEKQKIEEIHRQLLALTEAYLSSHRSIKAPDEIVLQKCAAFRSLQETLADSTKKTVAERVQAFVTQLGKINQATLKTHRTPAWQRYLYNVLSVLTVLPALFRAASSYLHYHTFKFWKPDSQRLSEYAAELSDNPILSKATSAPAKKAGTKKTETPLHADRLQVKARLELKTEGEDAGVTKIFFNFKAPEQQKAFKVFKAFLADKGCFVGDSGLNECYILVTKEGKEGLSLIEHLDQLPDLVREFNAKNKTELAMELDDGAFYKALAKLDLKTLAIQLQACDRKDYEDLLVEVKDHRGVVFDKARLKHSTARMRAFPGMQIRLELMDSLHDQPGVTKIYFSIADKALRRQLHEFLSDQAKNKFYSLEGGNTEHDCYILVNRKDPANLNHAPGFPEGLTLMETLAGLRGVLENFKALTKAEFDTSLDSTDFIEGIKGWDWEHLAIIQQDNYRLDYREFLTQEKGRGLQVLTDAIEKVSASLRNQKAAATVPQAAAKRLS